jgi:hypothetical protein
VRGRRERPPYRAAKKCRVGVNNGAFRQAFCGAS